MRESSYVPHANSDKDGATPETLPSLPIGASISPYRKKLLILDLNGLLVDIVSDPPKDCRPDIKISRRAIFKRPFHLDFLKFCFERFEVGIWSSRARKNVDRVVEYLLGDMKHKLLFCWEHTAIFPYPYQFQEVNDVSLGAGGDLRVHLERLAEADNVQIYVEQHPFGQKAVTESSASWDFYLRVMRSLYPHAT